MTISEVKELFRERTASYFSGYEVVFANQSRTAKPAVPLVTLTFGNVNRPSAPYYIMRNEYPVGYYLSRMPVTVDLFTNGRPIIDDDGKTVAYENTAIDELLVFCDYLNGESTLQWGCVHDVTILIEADAQELTGVVNDHNYEYRARQEISLYFMYSTDPGIDYSGHFTWANVSYDVLHQDKEDS